ncbi:hypothetical protein DXG03_000986 [Asterophora parasitica]|uniref:Uncharacterized protein n=1 Tax=Asterophora parasitica TaxID=117018 RepID=A0A9P7KAI9_9AGAR|nr:hypothetical protein DXG03_000986 [Asterophora parasitica]
MLSAIASACPGLRTLELEQAHYQQNESVSVHSMVRDFVDESLAQPLSILRDLRELRITLELGEHNRAALRRMEAVYTGIDDRIQEAAQIFAEQLPTLDIIGVLYANDFLRMVRAASERHCVWRRMYIDRGTAGDRPLVKPWMYM